ncbi:MAG: hypothetical protein AABZ67_00555 [Pseudomonadota bacterium]
MARIPLISGPQDLTQNRAALNNLINQINDLDFFITILSLIFQGTIRTVSGAFTVAAPVFVYFIEPAVNGASTATLPTSASWYAAYGPMFPVIFKDSKGVASSFNITVNPAGVETIDGLSSYAVAGDRAALALRPRPDGTGWVTT